MRKPTSSLEALNFYLNHISAALPLRLYNISILFLFVSSVSLFAQKNSGLEHQLTQEYFGSNRRNLVSQNINLNVLELRQFWPIYESYEKERADLAERRLSLLEKNLIDATGTTDAEMDLSHKQSVSIDKKLSEIRDKTYEKIKQTMGVAVAVRFLNLDSQIDLLITASMMEKSPLKGVTTKEMRQKAEEDRRKQIELSK